MESETLQVTKQNRSKMRACSNFQQWSVAKFAKTMTIQKKKLKESVGKACSLGNNVFLRVGKTCILTIVADSLWFEHVFVEWFLCDKKAWLGIEEQQ